MALSAIKQYLSLSQKNELGLRAAALTYYAIFSLFPLLLFVINGIRYLVHDPVLQNEMLTALRALPPRNAQVISDLIFQIATAHPIKNWIPAVSLMWSASGFLHTLLATIDHMHQSPSHRHHLTLRALGLLITLAFPPLFYLYFLLVSIGRLLWQRLQLPSQAILPANYLALILLTIIGFYLLYRFTPAIPTRRSRALLSAVFTALLWLFFTGIFIWYLDKGFARLNWIYGSLATVAALLLYLYLSNLAILLGAQLHAYISQPKNKR